MKGRICLVTGASGHTGRVVADALTASGARVFGVLSPRHPAAHIRTSGWKAVNADLTDEQSVQSVFDDLAREDAHPHVVVHAAGGYATSGTVADTTLDVWDRMLNINLRTTFLVTREAVRRMEHATVGRIIVFGARSGFGIPSGRIAYGISKTGVHLLVQTIAKENTNSGLTINAIAPGTIDTPDNRSSMAGADRSGWVSTEKIVEVILDFCRPENMTNGTILQL